jgi:hypothetical protein
MGITPLSLQSPHQGKSNEIRYEVGKVGKVGKYLCK